MAEEEMFCVCVCVCVCVTNMKKRGKSNKFDLALSFLRLFFFLFFSFFLSLFNTHFFLFYFVSVHTPHHISSATRFFFFCCCYCLVFLSFHSPQFCSSFAFQPPLPSCFLFSFAIFFLVFFLCFIHMCWCVQSCSASGSFPLIILLFPSFFFSPSGISCKNAPVIPSFTYEFLPFSFLSFYTSFVFFFRLLAYCMSAGGSFSCFSSFLFLFSFNFFFRYYYYYYYCCYCYCYCYYYYYLLLLLILLFLCLSHAIRLSNGRDSAECGVKR
ncbi:hypothetical protein TbgDal_IX5430 [Trypanosoma brucei gambiense DAL972]|uniref:Uncharacterized protein n=1 Tax=Trypanosoma brucei gambiense (strain MHOM/CI/86/DAL972) TaxID=679716 RepID=C9ZYG8_TRYB9|nr:hypothetical protein TbgDal_IX5430 [Trypanosoma brucei gambiense DAL972]CBH14467.1 hypothetical protein TbgDal_IX5430 [Trypanosoma brucei gambiense DAL972]|eukprot:XP_011776733.1 hypothetical protein TbgDal_IX5430 [Trypanosoma brucei gambiense DAL972]